MSHRQSKAQQIGRKTGGWSDSNTTARWKGPGDRCDRLGCWRRRQLRIFNPHPQTVILCSYSARWSQWWRL